MDRFILVIPTKARFLPLVRRATDTLAMEAATSPEKLFELRAAVTEACNLVSRAYGHEDTSKVISISATHENSTVLVTIDDGGDQHAGKRARQKIRRNELSFEEEMALKTTNGLCENVIYTSGITGGLRIELTKSLVPGQIKVRPDKQLEQK